MAHIESLRIPPTQCLIQFGHSIEQGANGKWYLTRLLQTVEELGESTNGFRRFIRTARREPVGSDTESAIVGGGMLTTAATAEVYKQLEARGETPKVIVHCGGRAGYLEKAAADPIISEGRVMQQVFNDRLQSQVKSPQVLIEQSRVTEDDIRNGLETALQFGCTSATFVGLEIRLPRCRAFYEKIISETDRFAIIQVNFLAAEDVIGDIARRKGRTAQWEQVLSRYHGSEGYKRTLENEQGGIAALKAGSYGQSLGGTGKT
ncbi:hypothetical protein HYU45_03710 [Candidatus Daviesbacteria bacterium]|nr:hypothetical protein [Candidatus Daviesbacteria bacterium]